MQDCLVLESVVPQRQETHQRLDSATSYSCTAPLSTRCSVQRTKASGWVQNTEDNAPPAKRPGALYFQHMTALVHATAFGDEESPAAQSNLTCWLQHTACMPGGDASTSCFAHGVWRFPCCQMDMRCP
eukprot:Tamp_21395.p1 GENE.Tamp_21395~~Tamp_21395.p1  ORF type:complete len:128 (-),score=18.64 Tamp_21395:188-571(-)